MPDENNSDNIPDDVVDTFTDAIENQITDEKRKKRKITKEIKELGKVKEVLKKSK